MMLFLTILLFSKTSFMLGTGTIPDHQQKKVMITSFFGERTDPFTKQERFHSGIDLRGKLGMKVKTIGAGRVVFAGNFGGYGNLVVIKHARGITSHYAHLGSIDVQIGEILQKRSQIGTLGNTGRSTGPHLHFEMRLNGKPFDPLTAL